MFLFSYIIQIPFYIVPCGDNRLALLLYGRFLIFSIRIIFPCKLHNVNYICQNKNYFIFVKEVYILWTIRKNLCCFMIVFLNRSMLSFFYSFMIAYCLRLLFINHKIVINFVLISHAQVLPSASISYFVYEFMKIVLKVE